MPIRRQKVTATERLRELEAKRVKLEQDAAAAEHAVAAARAAIDEAQQQDAAAYLGDIEPHIAQAALAAAEEQRQVAERELRRLQGVAPELGRMIEEQQAAVKAEELAAAETWLRNTVSSQVDASTKFAEALQAAVAGARTLSQLRAAVRARQQEVTALGGDRYAFAADEAEWPQDIQALLALLTNSAPERPVTTHEEYERRKAREAADAPRRERQHWMEQARALAAISWDPEETERKVEQFVADAPEALRDEVRAAYSEARSRVTSGRHGRALQRI